MLQTAMQMCKPWRSPLLFCLNRFSEYASHCGVLAYGGYLAVTGAAYGRDGDSSMSSSFSDQSNLKPVLYTGTIGSSRFRADLCCWMNPLNLKTQQMRLKCLRFAARSVFLQSALATTPPAGSQEVLGRSGSDDCSGGSLPVLAKALSST